MTQDPVGEAAREALKEVLDPETNLAGASALLQGYDFFNMPQTRSIVFTVGLNR